MTDDPLAYPARPARPARPAKRLSATMAGVVGLGAVLLSLPAREVAVPDPPPRGAPFVWNQDSLWRGLEAKYVALRATGCSDGEESRGISAVEAQLDTIASAPLSPADTRFDSLELAFFALGPVVAACPAQLHDYVTLSGRLRQVVKDQSRSWNPDNIEAKQRVYRLLYGARAAVEEAMLQHPDSADALLVGRDEPSATPSAE